MSTASCFVITALLLIRQVRPLPRRVIYPLWALAFFRLVIPFTLPTSWSLFNFTGGLVKRMITIETITRGTVPMPESSGLWAMNMVGAADEYAPVEYKTESLRQVFTAASVVWAIFAAAALIAVIILYTLTWKELKKAVRVKDNLYRSHMLLSPVLTGLIRPRIILPVSFDPDSPEGKMVLAHEKVHESRLDNLWRLIGICITCLHWFNPFAWIMLRSFFTDMEIYLRAERFTTSLRSFWRDAASGFPLRTFWVRGGATFLASHQKFSQSRGKSFRSQVYLATRR